MLAQIKANRIRQVTEMRWACNFDACGTSALQHENSLLVACLGRLCKVSYCICTLKNESFQDLHGCLKASRKLKKHDCNCTFSCSGLLLEWSIRRTCLIWTELSKSAGCGCQIRRSITAACSSCRSIALTVITIIIMIIIIMTKLSSS